MTEPADAATLPGRLVGFVEALRAKGVPAGPSETVDAAAVVRVLGLHDRTQLREGLASALVRRGGQRDVFDTVFDLYFPAGVGAGEAVREAHDEGLDADGLRDRLAQALAAGDEGALDRLAQVAVDLLGAVGQDGSGGWSAYQTLDRLAPQTLVARALQLRGSGGASAGAGTGQASTSGFTARLDRPEVREAVELFRRRVQAEARRRTAEVRGRDVVTKHAVPRTGDQVDFLSANQDQLRRLRLTVRPLSRKLATRLASRRRAARRGKVDVRRTLRRAASTGGVPVKPAWQRPRPSRPELVLLCDVSGSVAGFSEFTMLLVRALSDQFSRIRVFAFVNAMAEVTDLVRDGDDDLAGRIRQEARVTRWHTSSDYGEALGDFVAEHLDAVGPRTAVLVLGDARNNNLDPNLEALHRVAQRSRRTFWLNPEAASRWGLGDSVALEYAEVVPMHECCNVEQLTAFVTRLLPA